MRHIRGMLAFCKWEGATHIHILYQLGVYASNPAAVAIEAQLAGYTINIWTNAKYAMITFSLSVSMWWSCLEFRNSRNNLDHSWMLFSTPTKPNH